MIFVAQKSVKYKAVGAVYLTACGFNNMWCSVNDMWCLLQVVLRTRGVNESLVFILRLIFNLLNYLAPFYHRKSSITCSIITYHHLESKGFHLPLYKGENMTLLSPGDDTHISLVIYLYHKVTDDHVYHTAVQSQKAVTAYFSRSSYCLLPMQNSTDCHVYHN